jgi:hypothetical protein
MSPLLAAIVLVLVSGCASQPPPSPLAPGFLPGLGHGLIAPIAFVVSLFNTDVRLYAFPNSGVGYDVGFLLGLTVWAGGAATTGRRGGTDSEGEEEVSRLRRKVRRLRTRLRTTEAGRQAPHEDARLQGMANRDRR